MERLKILITGGTGFIGSNLVHFFGSAGHEIATTMKPQSNTWRISGILDEITTYRLDVTDRESVKNLFTSFRPDIAIHTIAYGGYHFETETDRILDNNFKGTVNVVDAYVKSSAELLINTGSSSEYGSKMHPMSEKDILEPLGTYAVSKAAASLYCTSKSIESNRRIITFRPFSAFGEFEESHRLIPYIILSALRGEVLNLNNPNNVRDYIYVQDVCNAYEELIMKHNKIEMGQVFNLGSGLESNVISIVNIIEKISGKILNLKWKYTNERLSDQAIHWSADMSKTDSILKWKPKYSLETGLSMVYQWFRENIPMYEVIENSKLGKIGK